MYSNDPVRDAEEYYRLTEEIRLKQRPICCECGEPIDDSYGYKVEDGIICEDCMYNHRVYF